MVHSGRGTGAAWMAYSNDGARKRWRPDGLCSSAFLAPDPLSRPGKHPAFSAQRVTRQLTDPRPTSEQSAM